MSRLVHLNYYTLTNRQSGRSFEDLRFMGLNDEGDLSFHNDITNETMEFPPDELSLFDVHAETELNEPVVVWRQDTPQSVRSARSPRSSRIERSVRSSRIDRSARSERSPRSKRNLMAEFRREDDYFIASPSSAQSSPLPWVNDDLYRQEMAEIRESEDRIGRALKRYKAALKFGRKTSPKKKKTARKKKTSPLSPQKTARKKKTSSPQQGKKKSRRFSRTKPKTFSSPRKWSRAYCKKTPCKKMGFSQKASCRPFKNCYRKK